MVVGFELVVELKKRSRVGFALKLGEFWELEVVLVVIDPGGDHRHNLTITKLCQREVKMISLVNYEIPDLIGENAFQLETDIIQVFSGS